MTIDCSIMRLAYPLAYPMGKNLDMVSPGHISLCPDEQACSSIEPDGLVVQSGNETVLCAVGCQLCATILIFVAAPILTK